MIFQKVIGPDMFSWISHYVEEVCSLPSALPVSIVMCLFLAAAHLFFLEAQEQNPPFPIGFNFWAFSRNPINI